MSAKLPIPSDRYRVQAATETRMHVFRVSRNRIPRIIAIRIRENLGLPATTYLTFYRQPFGEPILQMGLEIRGI